MNLTITARHFKAETSLKDLIRDKMNKLKTYYDGIIDCEVILSTEKDREIAEVIMKLDNDTVVLKEDSDSHYKSIELIADRLQVKLKRLKGKRNHFSHKKILDKIVPPTEVDIASEQFDY
ncbi:MAG: ribosome-associated translation inhibitor RaiA [Calditrichaeota bacterium]|nr:ribosome-associated translation inhibitor RaiA [Calditrichota bacterium]